MILQKPVGFIAVVSLRATPLQMLNLIEAYVLNFVGKVFLQATALNLADLTTRSIHTADVLLECLGHQLYTASS
jgi:hypothetical protein